MQHIWDELDEYRGTLFDGQWPTIAHLFLIAYRKYPHNNCFTQFTPQRETLDYAQVYREVMRVNSYLQENGLHPGDRVILNGKNSPSWAIAYLAVQFAGGVIVPLDNHMHPDRVMALSDFSSARFIFADADVLARLDENDPWVRSVEGRKVSLLGNAIKGSPSFCSIAACREYPPVSRTEDDMAAILYTSGTTGNEKGVVLTHKNIISDVYQAADGIFLHVTDKDVLYALLPLHHSYCCTGVFLETIKHGAECVFGQGIVVSRMINDLKRGNVTVFMGIPLLYNKVLSGMMKEVRKKGILAYGMVRLCMAFGGTMKFLFGWNPFRGLFNKLLLSKLGLDHNRYCICGAGPLAPKVFKQYQQLGLDFVQGYGLTETSPIVTLNPVSHFKIASVGKVLPLDEVVIGEPDAQGIGEIRVKGPNVTKGYYQDKEHTKELFDESGYLRTGDLGYLDKEGYVYLKGRAKNLIVTEGGKNVYPEEIEDMFQLYPEIQQILIRGYQEKKDIPSESIEAVVYPDPELKDAKRIDAIIKEINGRLSGYKKITKTTVLEKPMEMTTTQKIKRGLVHQEGKQNK